MQGMGVIQEKKRPGDRVLAPHLVVRKWVPFNWAGRVPQA